MDIPSSTTKAAWPMLLSPPRPRSRLLGAARSLSSGSIGPRFTTGSTRTPSSVWPRPTTTSTTTRALRPALLFAHGENFSRGIDVDAFAPLAKTGEPFAVRDGMLDPFARTQRLSKPLIVIVHGDTWNMGHELHLVADIRVASADVRYSQDENTHGRFPGGGSTIRLP
jgi:Enoyl-CoA hydratase/isomerase